MCGWRGWTTSRAASSTGFPDWANGNAAALARRRAEAAGAGLLLDADAAEALVEARELTTAVEQPLLTAGPGRMRFGIDFQPQRVAGLAIGRSRLVARAIGHHDSDLVIVRVNSLFHRPAPRKAAALYRSESRRATLQHTRLAGKSPWQTMRNTLRDSNSQCLTPKNAVSHPFF